MKNPIATPALASLLALSSVLSCRSGDGPLAPPVVPSGGGSGLGAGAALPNLLKEGSFEGGTFTSWGSYVAPEAQGTLLADSGKLCIQVVEPGVNEWDAQLRYRPITLEKGHTYTLRASVDASGPTQAVIKLSKLGPPYDTYFRRDLNLGGTPLRLDEQFVMNSPTDPTTELVLLAGKGLTTQPPVKVCLDDVSLSDPQWVEPAAAVIPSLHVNQLGYRPTDPKLAVLAQSAESFESPAPWSLIDSQNAELAQGSTLPFAPSAGSIDGASGDRLHWIDFSSFVGTCSGCRIKVGDQVSAPFDIRPDVYSGLWREAMRYFYHNRSGLEIKLPWALEAQWTRPAGHLSDSHAACLPSSPCDYTLDASGGWYDAGDHGKYLVNGGMALWVLQNAYERAQALRTSLAQDNVLSLPEAGNSLPDLLDEARWEADFFIRMQVPEGQPLAGMAHAKIHDAHWTSLGTAPHEDKELRYLHAPTTAATLNLAATAAQAARLWRSLDVPFAERALASAKAAYAAAKTHPAEYETATAANSVGGGPYDDSFVQDEFYWAAAELWATTGESEYATDARGSALFGAVPSLVAQPRSDSGYYRAVSWANVELLGTLSLLRNSANLTDAERAALRKALLSAADSLLAAGAQEGYRIPFRPGPGNQYLWGSNTVVLSNALVCATAYDLTQEPRYLQGVVDAADYVLGRNALDQSYVTGFGARPVARLHHRFWAHQSDPSKPPPPPGAMASGANSGRNDDIMKSSVAADAPPQRCYVDDIEAYSVNEPAVHQNAVLAWVAAFLNPIP